MAKLELKHSGRVAMLAALAWMFPMVAYGATAARVEFVVGDVKALGPSGKTRTLARGSPVEEGETVATNGGRAQLRFTDGAYVSLQPQSAFRIDEYRYDGRSDGNEKEFFSLLKGGVRTITGLVGRTNKQTYRIQTSVATIGIHGTEYTIQYGQSITGSIGEGETEVCNGTGCLTVSNGESYYVAGSNVKPVLTDRKTDLPPSPPATPLPDFLVGEDVDNTGAPCVITSACGGGGRRLLMGTQTLDLALGEFGLTRNGVVTNGGLFPGSTAVFDEQGKLLSINSTVASSVTMNGNDGVVAWGTFSDSSNGGQLAHFVAGLPVPSSDLRRLGSTTGNYTLLGATSVTNPSNQTIGTLNSATLAINFGTASVTANMNWTIAGQGSVSAPALTGTVGQPLTGSCGASCSVEADLALFGPNASRAGMAYGLFGANFSGIGAAAFVKR
jgi:hypothetical protein